MFVQIGKMQGDDLGADAAAEVGLTGEGGDAMRGDAVVFDPGSAGGIGQLKGGWDLTGIAMEGQLADDLWEAGRVKGSDRKIDPRRTVFSPDACKYELPAIYLIGPAFDEPDPGDPGDPQQYIDENSFHNT